MEKNLEGRYRAIDNMAFSDKNIDIVGIFLLAKDENFIVCGSGEGWHSDCEAAATLPALYD